MLKLQKRLFTALIMFIIVSVPVGFAQGESPEEGPWIPRESKIRGESYLYQVHLPRDWSPLEQSPVILFLHGLGERGQDGLRQTRVGLGAIISQGQKEVPAIVIAPQCRRGMRWDDPVMEELVLNSLRSSLAEFNGDPARVYLTGISMGGYATFYFAARHPDLFAALVPVSGGILLPRDAILDEGSDPEAAHHETARKISHIPTWIFHGSQDTVVPVSESRKMARALKGAGGKVRFTEYSDAKHNSWDRAYSEDGLFMWMLSHRRSGVQNRR